MHRTYLTTVLSTTPIPQKTHIFLSIVFFKTDVFDPCQVSHKHTHTHLLLYTGTHAYNFPSTRAHTCTHPSPHHSPKHKCTHTLPSTHKYTLPLSQPRTLAPTLFLSQTRARKELRVSSNLLGSVTHNKISLE